MVSKVAELFEKHNEEYRKFDRINKPLSRRPDLCAFLLLDKLYPGIVNIIAASEHDEIYLDIESTNIEHASEADIIDLIRCGVRYNSYMESLCMFV